MTQLRTLCAFLVVLALGAAGAAAQEGVAEAQWLMVIQGTVTDVSDGTVAMAVSPAAVVFTDRPERRAGLIDLATFAATAWAEDGAFGIDPPNASLIDESNSTIAVITVVKLTVTEGIATLQVTVLEGALPGIGDGIALTIDAYPTSVNGQITDAVTGANTSG